VDGNVCISILHTGEDRTGYELASERWSPVQSVEKVLLSVISMLAGTSKPVLASFIAVSYQFVQNLTWRAERTLIVANCTEITSRWVPFSYVGECH
jgi:hypothetical protein